MEHKKGDALYALAMTVIGVLAVWFLYYSVVQPILVRFTDDPDAAKIETDLALFTGGEYRSFEDGETFHEILKTVPSITRHEPVAFYHQDTKVADNPIYGKHADYFLVDFQLDQEAYLREKEQFVSSGSFEKESVWGSFTHYLTKNDRGVFGVSFRDSDCLIRITLITEIEDFDSFYNLALSSMDVEWSLAE